MNIRYPAVSGTFYPSEKSKLTGTIQSFLDQAPMSQKGEPVWFIVPHTGYIYSDTIAAYAFKYLEKKEIIEDYYFHRLMKKKTGISQLLLDNHVIKPAYPWKVGRMKVPIFINLLLTNSLNKLLN